MNIALWVVQVILALAFGAAGILKATKSNAELHDRMAYVEDFSDAQVTGIGVVEVLGALGLVLPGLTGIAPVLTPLAATGLVVTMALAAVVHVRRGEGAMIAPNVVLGLGAAFVAWGRFGPYPL